MFLAEKFLPRTMLRRKPVSQFYINKDGITTNFSFLNFPSLFSPQTADKCFYTLKLHAPNGKVFAKKDIEVAKLGAKFINVNEEFGNDIPEMGVLTANIKYNKEFTSGDRHLGKLTAHFYVMFQNKKTNSLGVVHPQTVIKKTPKKPMSWTSNHVISTKGLSKIVTLQQNPTNKAATSNISLTDMGDKKLQTQENLIASMGVVENIWDLKNAPENVTFYIDKMTTANAKPLLFLYFEDGSFSVSHA